MKEIRFIKCFLGILGLIIVWFVAIDKSYFVETCNDCFFNRDIIKIRELTIPIYSKVRESKNLVSYVGHVPQKILCQNNYLLFGKLKVSGTFFF